MIFSYIQIPLPNFAFFSIKSPILLKDRFLKKMLKKSKNTSRSGTASVTCCRSLWMMQIDTWPWSHTCWGHMILTGTQVHKWVKFHIFRLSYKLTSHDLWPLWPLISWTCENSYLISINQVWFQSDFNFSNDVNFTYKLATLPSFCGSRSHMIFALI